MEFEFLKELVDNNPEVSQDLNAPLSYLEWKQTRSQLVETDSVVYYNRYLAEWFENNKNKALAKKFVLRQKYLYLLDQLQLFFSTDEKNNWYNQINLADEKELLLSIPYFAKRLKQCVLYYLQLRKQLKNVKLKYNTKGTKASLEAELRRAILGTFSSLNEEIPTDLQKYLPSFETLQENLVVDIEEMYDDTQYFDRSTTLPSSAYYDPFHEATSKFFQTKGITLSTDEWVFSSTNLQLSANFESFFDTLTSNIFDQTDSDLYYAYLANFLSENKLTLDLLPLSSTFETFDIAIETGNNFFYYPYGSVDTSISIEGQIPPVLLSSLDINGATAGLTIENSDTIFVKNGNTIEGAWYRLKEFSESQEVMRAFIPSNRKVSFIFPYPGYGLSGDDFEWTGPTFETNSEYSYLSQEYKALVDKAYWSQALTDSAEPLALNSCTALLLNSTTSTHPLSSDKILLRKRTSEEVDTTTALRDLSGAWLYKYSTTSLPVIPSDDNVYIWPYQLLDIEEPYPDKFLPSNIAINNQNVISINTNNSLKNSGFNGTEDFATSDKIYKLANHTDSIDDALECVWYFVPPTISTNGLYKYYLQDNISYYFESGSNTKFIWTGNDNTPLSSVFVNIQHQPNCPFNSSSYTELSSYTKFHSLSTYQWDKCTCKQTFYTPFGHNGDTFDENSRAADFIVELNTLDVKEDFDLATWTFNGFSYTNSNAKFAWYKSFDSNQKWGYGNWVSNNGALTDFRLRSGKEYIYVRAKTPYSEDALCPYIVTKNLNNTGTKGTWRQAKKDEFGQWVGLNKVSTMTISEKDIIKIDRQENSYYYYLSTYNVENASENKGSIWSTYDYIALDSISNFTTISWPFDGIAPLGSNDPQYPNTSFSDLTGAFFRWTITLLSADDTGTLHPTPSSALFNQELITFTPLVPGFYQISAVAIIPSTTTSLTFSAIDVPGYDQQIIIPEEISTGSNTFIEFTNIPLLTVVPEYKDEIEEIEFTYPLAGFLLEIDLPNPINYWADLFLDKDSNTNYKGINSWGYPNSYVNDYLPNTIPKFSELFIEYNTILEYERIGSSFRWNQPFVFKKAEQTKQWSKLEYNTNNYSVLSSVFISKQHPTLETYPLNVPSSIILSNVLNSSPVEVYYNALNSFVWTVSTELPQSVEIPPSTLLIDSVDAYTKTLLNRFNATIATVPVLEKAYTSKAIGSYLLPQNLGLTYFINKDFVPILSADNAGCYPNTGCPYSTLLSLQDSTTNILTGTFIVENTNVHIGGRGITKQDQPTLYTWNEYNQWMKEAPSTGSIAGMPKKSLTKSLQTFIPYKSNNENVSLGLITPQSRVSPWGGNTQETWTDALNEPKSFTGVRNVSAWSDSQILKQSEKELYNWTTDIYGNQYGLFKQTANNSNIHSKEISTGEIWTKSNKGIIQPATISLSSAFNAFKASTNETVYDSLTGSVLNIECYFDTLVVFTDQILLLLSLDYDYESGLILTNIDSSKYILNSENYRYNDVWFFPENKKLYILSTQLSGTTFIPELKILDLVNKTLATQYPLFKEKDTFLNAISAMHVSEIYEAKLNYNSLNKTFLLTYNGKTVDDRCFVCLIKIKSGEILKTNDIHFYLEDAKEFKDIYPPYISQEQLSKLYYVANGLTNFIYLTAENNPTHYELFNTESLSNSFTTLSVDNSGVFVCVPNETGLFFLNFKVFNDFGSTTYGIALSSVDGAIVTIENGIPIITLENDLIVALTLPELTPTPSPTPTPIPVFPNYLCVTEAGVEDANGQYQLTENTILSAKEWVKQVSESTRITIRRTFVPGLPNWWLKSNIDSNAFYYNDSSSLEPPTTNWYVNSAFPEFGSAPSVSYNTCLVVAENEYIYATGNPTLSGVYQRFFNPTGSFYYYERTDGMFFFISPDGANGRWAIYDQAFVDIGYNYTSYAPIFPRTGWVDIQQQPITISFDPYIQPTSTPTPTPTPTVTPTPTSTQETTPTPTPTPSPTAVPNALLVSNAGNTEINGFYIESGFFSGKKFYNLQPNGEVVIAWDGVNWVIRNLGGITLYISTEDVEFPWQVIIWSPVNGNLPVPILTPTDGTFIPTSTPTQTPTQTPTPTQFLPQNICVTGAGINDVNGTYSIRNNLFYGIKEWFKTRSFTTEIVIRKTLNEDAPFWMVKPSYSNTFYFNDSNDETPPLTNWYTNPSYEVLFGSAPSLAHGVCLTPTPTNTFTPTPTLTPTPTPTLTPTSPNESQMLNIQNQEIISINNQNIISI